MTTIVIHAGMPKAGSTSIQRWIAGNSQRLRNEYAIQVLVATSGTQANPTECVHLEPHESGEVNSSALIKSWRKQQQAPEIASRFVDELSQFAEQHPTVLITGEALSQAFWRAEETFLLGFEQLARVHDVRVAYYVRPQHTAIEAGWREAGYKGYKEAGYTEEMEPSEYALEQSKRLHYLQTLDAVRELAPHVRFDVRPFLIELLDGGGPVTDFLRRFLSLEEEADEHRNPGLPLQLVNALRHAPDGMFWSGERERYPRKRMVGLFEGLVIAESARIRRSRLILQAYCRRVFESENQELIQRLKWPISHLVPPTDALDGDWQIDELDLLWSPEASEAELALLYRALSAALAQGTAEVGEASS
jgi:hypothetical protein